MKKGKIQFFFILTIVVWAFIFQMFLSDKEFFISHFSVNLGVLAGIGIVFIELAYNKGKAK